MRYKHVQDRKVTNSNYQKTQPLPAGGLAVIFYARDEGIEPPTAVLETAVIPFN